MATYNTVPDDETSSLQNKPETKSLKYIVAGAAAASFLIGVALDGVGFAILPAPPRRCPV